VIFMELKFRGRNVIDHNWYYGYYVLNPVFGATIYSVENRHGLVAHIVNPNTVGVWIGELDCNGIEIYHNDIVRVDDIKLKGSKNFELSDEVRHRFKFGVVEVKLPHVRVREISEGKRGFYDDLGETFSWHDAEVVGTILDPPLEILMLNLDSGKYG
jgi:hypothetical protein